MKDLPLIMPSCQITISEGCRKASCVLSARRERDARAPAEDKHASPRYDVSIIPAQDMSLSVNLMLERKRGGEMAGTTTGWMEKTGFA